MKLTRGGKGKKREGGLPSKRRRTVKNTSRGEKGKSLPNALLFPGKRKKRKGMGEPTPNNLFLDDRGEVRKGVGYGEGRGKLPYPTVCRQKRKKLSHRAETNTGPTAKRGEKMMRKLIREAEGKKDVHRADRGERGIVSSISRERVQEKR